MNIYLVTDLALILFSVIILTRNGKLRFYHPGTMLLLFHIFSNTFRYWSVLGGANLAFESSVIQGASLEELDRALLLADVALFACTIAIVIADNTPVRSRSVVEVHPLNDRIFKAIMVFTIPLGLVGAVTSLYIPTVKRRIADVEASSSLNFADLTSTWFGLSLLALVYFKGFKWKYLIPLFIYLGIIAIQGYHRYRLVLPCMFLLITYLYYNHRKWPKRIHLVALFTFTFIAIPLKQIGTAIQQGKGLTNIVDIVEQSMKSSTSGNSDDQVFFDQYAMTLTEIDRKEAIYYGSTITPLFTLPIPRSSWKEKPKLNQWQDDISTSARPFSTIGSIGTIYGEAYANFRIFGVAVIPALLFFLLTRWYKRVKDRNIFDMSKFFYSLIFVCMIQVMRDGVDFTNHFPGVKQFAIVFNLVFAPRVCKIQNYTVSQLMRRIILVGILPPPYNGQSVAFRVLVDALEKGNLDFKVIDISGSLKSRHNKETPIFRALDYLFILSKLFRACLNTQALVYIQVSQSRNGFWRDILINRVCKLFNSRIVAHMHGGNFDGFYESQGRRMKGLIQEELTKYDKIIVLSENLKKMYDFQPIIRDRIVSIPNGISSPVKHDFAKNIKQEKTFNILYLSNLIETKGYLVLLKSLSILKASGVSFSAFFCGQFSTSSDHSLYNNPDDARVDFFRLVSEYNLDAEVIFKGVVTGTEKEGILQAAHFFVLPTQYVNEGQPISIIEAMRVGCVIITTNYRAIPEMIEDGETGFLLNHISPEEIARLIMLCISNPDLFAKISSATIRKYKENFTEQIHGSNMLKLLRELAH
jgi:oligosaccharide repeat unit polymerase